MKLKINKKIAIPSIGAGVGVLQVVTTKHYNFLPGLFPFLPSPWDGLDSTGNIIIGAVALGISQFTKLLNKHHYIKQALGVYAFTIITGGILNGLFPATLSARAPTGRVATLSHGRNGYISQTYYPYYDYARDAPIKGRFIDRPTSRAQGFASDITRNPMAAIPTTIPYNKIIA